MCLLSIQCLFRRYSGVLPAMPVGYFSVQAISASFLVIRRVTSILRPQYRAFPENVQPFDRFRRSLSPSLSR